MGSTVAVVNNKGGVGKTTITLGLASAAKAAGHRVLVVDADPQASSTWALGVDPSSAAGKGVDASFDEKRGGAASFVVASHWGELVDVLPASSRLQERERDLDGKKAALRLRRALDGLSADYELVLIDSPPTLGLLTQNALAAADLVLLVVEPAALSLRGVAAVADAIDGAWEQLNPSLDIAGVIVNREPAVSSEADRQLDALARQFGKKAIWEPHVPQRVVLTEAIDARRPIHEMGYRAAAVALIFDQLYARLRRTSRRAHHA